MKTLLLVLLVATPALAQAEDDAHRRDRERTEQLNRQAAKAVASRDDRNDANQRAYQAARADYARRMAEWRRRVAACNAGDRSACQ